VLNVSANIPKEQRLVTMCHQT